MAVQDLVATVWGKSGNENSLSTLVSESGGVISSPGVVFFMVFGMIYVATVAT